MKFYKKIFSIIAMLGMMFSSLPATALAITNISVPAPTAKGQILVSPGAGVYQATTTSPIVVGGIIATSTIATSTIAGALSIQNYIVGTTTTVCTWPELCTYQVVPGSTHAGVQVQAALDALKNMGGGTVIIKKGTYNTNESNNNIVMATSTCIAGEGDGTNIVLTTAGVGVLFPEVSGACMHDLKITDGSSLSSPSLTGYALVQIRNSSNVKVNNVTVANANGFAFYIVSTGGASTTGVTLINNNLQCNGHQDCIGGGPTVQTLSTTSDITIIGNTITQTLLSGGTLNSNMDANCVDIVQALSVNFSNNDCKGRIVLGNEKYPNSQDTVNGNIVDAPLGLTKVSGQISVYESGTIAGQQVSVQGNTLKNGTIYVNGISGTPVQGVNASGNIITSSLSTYQNDDNNGIRFDYVSNSRIENNIMVAGDTTKTGISVTNSTNVTAANNHIKDFSVGVNLNAGSGNKSIFNDFNNVATPGTDIATISMNSASVGIGTNAAGTKLDVTGAANTGFTNNPKILRLQTTDAFAANMGGGIGFGGVYTGTSQADLAYIGGLKENGTDGDYGGKLVFGTRTNGSGATDMARLTISSVGNVSVATTTAAWLLTSFSSTAPQLALSAGAGISQWTMRNSGGVFYIATTTAVGTATSSTAALTIDANGKVLANCFSTDGGATCMSSLSTPVTVANGGTGTSNGSITGTGALTFTAGGTNNDVKLVNAGTGVVLLGSATNLGNTGHTVEIIGSSTKTPLTVEGGSGEIEFWKDTTPTRAIAFGMAKPGVSITNDFVLSTYDGGSWNEYFRLLNSNGFIGVGTSTPVYRTTSFSSTAAQLALSAGAGISQWTMRAESDGGLDISTTTIVGTATSSVVALGVTSGGVLKLGNYANCNGTTNALGVTSGQVLCDSLTSDGRLKKEITPLSQGNGIDTILQLKPVSFYWKDLTNHNTTDPREQFGFIAQDVQNVVPNAVGTSPDGYLTLDKTVFISPLVSAVQYLNKRINDMPQVTAQAQRSAEENWQWLAIGLMVVWNLYLTFRKKK